VSVTDQDVTPRGPARWLGRLRRFFDPEGEATRRSVRWLAHKFPELFDTAQRQSIEMRGLREELEAQNRRIATLTRDVGWMRRATTRQRAITADLLHLAGLQERPSERARALHDRMGRIAASNLPIVVGPWTGEVGFELLYWIPFLQALRQTYPIDPGRLIVISRGGVRPWYRHVGGDYVETFDITTPERFREATEAVKKQRNPRAFEKTLVKAALRARGRSRLHLIHPSLMYELLWSFWAYLATVSHVDRFTSFRRLPSAAASLPPGLPDDYVAVRFYFSECFPDTPANRAFIGRTIDTLAARTHVVLLNTSFAVDDHRDFVASRSDRVHTIAEHMSPSTNLATQTAVIERARAFVGTYGGYAYLAPFCGVNSIAFYSRTTFKRQHLDLAHRVFERLGPARLMPVDLRAVEAVELAFAGALREAAPGSPAGARS
jgi:hypothetical protein